MNTLLLRLAGPLQSWGLQSRFLIRDTALEPSKSGVVGLLAAALGRSRQEPVDDLAALKMGVRVEREGRVQMDYQTVGGSRQGENYGVAIADGSKPRTVTSPRYYLADAEFLVGLEGEDEAFLRRLDRALARPRWPLFLGRKAYVPSRPVRLSYRPPELPGASDAPGLVHLPLRQALARYPLLVRTRREQERLHQQAATTGLRLRLVLEAPFGTSAEVRPDQPLSFAILDRRYLPRYVTTEYLTIPPELIQEDPHVSVPSPA